MKEISETEKRDAVRSLLGSLLEKKSDRTAFTDEDSLVLSGRLDSLDVIDLISFLEERFGLDFADDGFDQHELDSVNAILGRVAV